ncbi:MAG: ARMT1-like domain-containing protein [Candidatus Lokiarchaeota archaeon]
MKLEPICVGCLFNQVYKTLKLLKSDVSKKVIIDTQKKLMKFLLESNLNDLSAPLIGKYVYELVGDVLNEKDPFREHKKEYNKLALKYYDELKRLIQNSKNPLFKSIIVSALGNTIDFASQHKIDIVKDLKKFSKKDLIINDFPKFEEALTRKIVLVILLDNAGEIVFDKILIETLIDKYPQLEIICAVRTTPIINDATIEDAEYVNLTSIVKVIDSSPAPGIDFSNLSEDLEKLLYNEKVIILSKGQGNFETLYDVELPNLDIFYLLKAKCELMEEIFNVKIGKLIFKKKSLKM